MHPRVHIAIRALRNSIIFRIHVNIFFQELNYYIIGPQTCRRGYHTHHSQLIESIKKKKKIKKKSSTTLCLIFQNFKI